MVLSTYLDTDTDTEKSISDNQIAKIDESINDSYKFRKRGNEEQFKHNNKVFVKLAEVKSEIDHEHVTADNIDNAKRKITEGMDLVKGRQKLIKLADSTEAGWRVVDEYVSNPLADNSDDEKKIYKAKVRAESKIKKEKLKRRTERKNSPYTPLNTTRIGNSIPVNINSTSTSKLETRPGRCFYCNEFGHWIRNCPKATSEQKNKGSG